MFGLGRLWLPGEEAVGSGPGGAFGHPANGAQAVPALAHPVQLARRGRQHAAGAARGVVQASHDSVLQVRSACPRCARASCGLSGVGIPIPLAIGVARRHQETEPPLS